MKNENRILEYLTEKETASSAEISETFGISLATVRRRLTELESKGLIKRTHGGAKIINPNNLKFNFSLRVHTNGFEKRLIALKAIKLIKEGDVVFLDGSTSTYFLAEYLNEFKTVTVITNGIDTLSLLAKKGVRAISTGGAVSKENTSVLIGERAIETINGINADLCFFSCQSCNGEGLISDCYLDENYIRRAMMKNSEKSVFLCDSTKIGKVSPFSLCSVNDVDYTIVDKDLGNYFENVKNCKIIF